MSEEITEALATLARLNAEAEEIVEAEPTGGALVPVAGKAVDPVSMKRGMAEMRALAIHKQNEIREAAKHAKDLLDAQVREMQAMLAPLQKQVARMEEAIETVNLYLGRDEEIHTLRDGEPAPAETPITLRSMVLSMAEETAIDPEAGGIDAQDIEAFDEWLMADPTHLDQVLPETRGVVVLVPTFDAHRDYGSPWNNEAMAKANAHSYWLIRNGERVFRMDCSLDVGRRLIGSRTEFTDLFYDEHVDWNDPQRRRVKVEMKPGTWEWEKAQEAADAKTRHYMKIALVLQGLVDRTTVLHPLPSPALSLLGDAAYEAGYVRLIEDDQNVLTTGREPFYDWLKRLNAELRPGMRIVGAFNSDGWRQWSYSGREGHERVTPSGASWPQSLVLHMIEEVTKDGQFVIRYQRTDEVWKRGVPVPDQPGYVYRGYMPTTPKVRASARLDKGDKFIIPIDLVTADEMQAYLESRTERHAYVDSFPLLRAAIRVKREEAAAEEPFRVMLTGRLMTDHDLDETAARAAVGDLVAWWKFTNKHHRPLVGEGEHEAKAVKMIVGEYEKRLKAEASDDPQIVAELRALPGVMLVARQRDGGYLALAPEERNVPETAGPRNVWAHEWTRRPKGAMQERSWVLVNGPRAARWRVLWSDERWEGWDRLATYQRHLTDPEIHALIAQVAERMEELCTATPDSTTSVRQGRKVKPGVTLATTYSHKDRLAHVYRLPTNPIHSHWTGRGGEQVRVWDCPGGWKRTSGNAVTHHEAEYLDERTWQESHRVFTETIEEHTPWRGHEPIYLDASQVERAHAAFAEIKQMQAERRVIDDRRRDLVNSIEKQWWERAEAEAYDRFIEDYSDPSLWEGHRKTLKIVYPRRIDRELEGLVETLDEQGIDLDGLTVREAEALMPEPHEPLDGFGDYVFRAPEPEQDEAADQR